MYLFYEERKWPNNKSDIFDILPFSVLKQLLENKGCQTVKEMADFPRHWKAHW